MSEWPSFPLVELVQDGQISYGVVQPGSDTRGGVPIVRVKDVRNGIIDATSPIRVAPEIAEKHSRTTLTGGELLLSLVGTVGESAVAPTSLAGWNVARAIAVIRPTKVSSRWLQLCFESAPIRAEILGVLNTTVQSTLNLADLKRLRIPVPPSEIRSGIEEVLGALDDKIVANAKLAATADDLLAARFESIVGATNKMVRLSELADVNRSTVKPSPGGQLRYIDIASVEVGSYKFPSVTQWVNAPSRARRGICKGDTLWSTVRPNRRSHALNLSDDPLLVASTGLAVLTARTVGWAYLYEVTRRPEFTAYLETVAEGSAYPAVRADKFGEALVPLADQASQRSFEQLAEPLREELHSLEQENQTLAATRDTLLPQLMSGKLRVKDAEKVLENAGVYSAPGNRFRHA